MTPKELVVCLRHRDCDCCPIYNECMENMSENCLLLTKAADCIETLLKKGN